ncbi:MAG: DUF1573 domain-containing protein [Patescibacteria group bacterium]|nr:DUF1573 domain-containing protein [Patescibacteria group bacterium]
MNNRLTHSLQKFFWQLVTIFGLVILLASPITSALQAVGSKQGIAVFNIVGTVEAKEIYPMFTCPCCGKPLDKEDPCCGSMTQMIDFIDQKVSTGANENEVILATAQEFGLERLADESQRIGLHEQLLANAPPDAPRITVLETKKDLGIVSQTKGIISTEFVIKNEGKSDLIINKLSSSCGCTSGSLVYQGVEGPKFFMPGHGQTEPDPNWQVAIAPGKDAQVRVYYDPTVHPDLTGPVTRTVSVHSNDPVDFETQFTITLDQEK